MSGGHGPLQRASFGGQLKAGCTAQGLAVENVFLDKYRNAKGIRAPTFEQEKARRNRRGRGGRAVAVAPVMNAVAVQERFDE